MGYHEIDIVEKPIENFRSSVALKVWNIATALGLIVPFAIFGYSRIANTAAAVEEEDYNDEGEGNGHEEEENDTYQEESMTPWWWSWKEDLEEEAQQHIVMTLVYVWTFLLVVILAILVNRNFNLGKLKSVRWFLIGFINYALVCSALVGGIPQLIEDKGEELEEIGWYGQISVLVLLSCVLEMMFSLFLALSVECMIRKQRRELKAEGHPYAYF